MLYVLANLSQAEYCLLGYNLLKINWLFGRTCCLHLHGQRISRAGNQCERWQGALPTICFHTGLCSAYSSTLKIEATCSSKESVSFQQGYMALHIPSYSSLHDHRCENLKSYNPAGAVLFYFMAKTKHENTRKLSLRKRVLEHSIMKCSLPCLQVLRVLCKNVHLNDSVQEITAQSA
jgi:hypothetical protein